MSWCFAVYSMDTSKKETVMVTGTTMGITDPMLHAIYLQHEESFKSVKKQIDDLSPEWNALPAELKTYQENVDVEARKFQYNNGKIPIPPKEELVQTLRPFVADYWKFKATCDKMIFLIGEIKNTQNFLTPQLLSERVKREQPELYGQLKIIHESCTKYFETLGQEHKKLEGLHQQIKLELNGNIAWSVQRFNNIVNNEGQPLSNFQRARNNVYTPFVPSLESLGKSPLFQEEKNTIPEGTATIFKPTLEGTEVVFEEASGGEEDGDVAVDGKELIQTGKIAFSEVKEVPPQDKPPSKSQQDSDDFYKKASIFDRVYLSFAAMVTEK